jgi:hypothetical protein
LTVANTTRKAGPFTGNGVTTSFPFTFKVFTSADLEVTLTAANGSQTVLTLNSHYSVSLNVDQDNNPGGTITYPLSGAALAASASLTILGDLAADQTTDITNLGNFLPQVHENAFDKLTILIQQLVEKYTRALVVPVNESVTPGSLPNAVGRAGKFLAFDVSGDPVASAGTGVDSALRTDLAASSGSTLVTFLPAGAGAVTRTAQNKMREVEVSVTEFALNGVSGTAVDPTGAADSTAGIQAAAVAAAGKRLVFPSGTYKITGAIALSSNTDVYLEPGAHITTATANISVFTATNKSKVWVYGAGKLSQTVAGANAYIAGVAFSGCTDCTVSGRLEFEGFQWAGVYILNSHRCKVTGTYMHDWLGSVDNSAGVIVYQDSDDNVVEGNHFKATGWLGAYVQDPGGAGTYNPRRNKIRNNRIEGATAYGAMLYIGAAGNSYNEITGNTISGVLGTAGLGQYGMGIYCVGFGLGGCKVIGNSVTNCCISQTVTTNGYAGIVVTGNTTGYAKPIIEGNSVDGMTQGGGIQVISCPGGAVVGPNSVHIPSTNNGTGPGGASLLGMALFIWNSDDVSVAPGDYVNAGTGAAVQINATDANHENITVNLGNAKSASSSAVLVSRTAAFTVSGTITGGTAKSTADAATAMSLLGFSGTVSGVRVRGGTTVAAGAALVASNCTNLRFSNCDVETTGNSATYSVSIGAGCTGNWDKSNRFVNRFENSASGFQTEFWNAGQPVIGIFQIGDRAVNASTSRVVGAAKAWTRAVAGSAHVLGVDWISEGNL